MKIKGIYKCLTTARRQKLRYYAAGFAEDSRHFDNRTGKSCSGAVFNNWRIGAM